MKDTMKLLTGTVLFFLLTAFAPGKRIPILMYHHIGDMPGPGDSVGRGLTVTQKIFGKQLDALGKAGYETIDFRTLANTGAVLPKKPVILTFDDGYVDAYENALPILKAHKMRATFFIVTGFVGKPHYVLWDELKKMSDAGMEIGAHTVDHRNLRILTPKEQMQDIGDSITMLERTLGIKIGSFAYPSGKFTKSALKILRNAGIPFAVTTREGIATEKKNPLLLPRIRMTERIDIAKTLAADLGD